MAKSKVLVSCLFLPLLAAAIFAAGVCVGWGTYRPFRLWQMGRQTQAREARLVGRPAPDINTTTLTGQPWRLADQTGRLVVITFWATWSSLSYEDLPRLKELQTTYGSRDDFMLVSVSLDDTPRALTEVCQREGITWQQLIEPGKRADNSVARAFEVDALPDTFIVGKDGIVSDWVISGFGGHDRRLIERVGRLLSDGDE